MSLSLDIRALRQASEKIEAEMAEIATSLAATKAPDYAAYTEKRGIYWGLQKALEVLREVEKTLK